MCVMNSIDRFHLAIDAIDRLPQLGDRAAHARQHLQDRLIQHWQHTRSTGEDAPEISDWSWTRPYPVTGTSAVSSR
jgi:xylulose-5-phosphate/fructose-6-phosphate phosphoketolase